MLVLFFPFVSIKVSAPALNGLLVVYLPRPLFQRYIKGSRFRALQMFNEVFYVVETTRKNVSFMSFGEYFGRQRTW